MPEADRWQANVSLMGASADAAGFGPAIQLRKKQVANDGQLGIRYSKPYL
jgi:hypothetical protein